MKKDKLIHVVTFRISDGHWLRLLSAARAGFVKPNDWVRDLTIQTLTNEASMPPNDRRLFDQLVRTHYLIANGFQLLADDKLSLDEWKKVRVFAKEKLELISSRALAELTYKNFSTID